MSRPAVIHPTAMVDTAAELAEGVEIGPYCVITGPVSLGPRVRVIAHAHLSGRTTIGADTVIHPFAALGGAPQDHKHKGEPTSLAIGERVVIREHVTMHRGTEAGRRETRIGDDCYFMVATHIAHDCLVGDGVTLANNAMCGGYCTVEDRANLGGGCALHQHTRIGRHAFVGGVAKVAGDVIPFGLADGTPARLAGLNLRGLTRSGFARETIHALRAAYKLIAADEGAFQERVARIESELAPGHSEVQEIVDFIRAPAKRRLCMP